MELSRGEDIVRGGTRRGKCQCIFTTPTTNAHLEGMQATLRLIETELATGTKERDNLVATFQRWQESFVGRAKERHRIAKLVGGG